MDFHFNWFGLPSFTSLVRTSGIKDLMRIHLYVKRWSASKRRSWKGFWRQKKVHIDGGLAFDRGRMLWLQSCISYLQKTKSTHNQTIRYHFHHTLEIHFSTHSIENPLHVLPDVPNWEFTVHCRAESGIQIPVITMVLLAGSVGWPGATLASCRTKDNTPT